MLDDDRSPGPEVLSALPIFPLPNTVLLPGMVLPLNVFEPRYLDLVDHVLQNGRHIGVPLLRPGYETDYDARPEVERVFGLGKLLSHQRLSDGRRFIRLEGLGRVEMLEELPPQVPFRRVAAQRLPEEQPDDDNQLEVLKAQVERIAQILDDEDEEMVRCVLQIPDPRILVYAITAILPTLGMADVHCLPKPGTRLPILDLQQRCLSAVTADDRVAALLDCAASICAALEDSGRFTRAMLN